MWANSKQQELVTPNFLYVYIYKKYRLSFPFSTLLLQVVILVCCVVLSVNVFVF